jgi:hypothetical protein
MFKEKTTSPLQHFLMKGYLYYVFSPKFIFLIALNYPNFF